MDNSAILVILFSIIFIRFFVVSFLLDFIEYLNLKKKGNAATGKIIDFVKRSDYEGSSYIPVVEFFDQDGKRNIVEIKEFSTIGRKVVDVEVSIKYLNNEVIIDNKEMNRLQMGKLIAILIGVFGIAYLNYAKFILDKF